MLRIFTFLDCLLTLVNIVQKHSQQRIYWTTMWPTAIVPIYHSKAGCCLNKGLNWVLTICLLQGTRRCMNTLSNSPRVGQGLTNALYVERLAPIEVTCATTLKTSIFRACSVTAANTAMKHLPLETFWICTSGKFISLLCCERSYNKKLCTKMQKLHYRGWWHVYWRRGGEAVLLIHSERSWEWSSQPQMHYMWQGWKRP